MNISVVALSVILISHTLAGAVAVAGGDDLLRRYNADSSLAFSAQRGSKLWSQENRIGDEIRTCTTCHGADLKKSGKHPRTKKPIEPLAPSVNPLRLTDHKRVEKWFKRNCTWTLGRECSAQEKGDLLTFIFKQ